MTLGHRGPATHNSHDRLHSALPATLGFINSAELNMMTDPTQKILQYCHFILPPPSTNQRLAGSG